jgi:hypothetical protein
LVIVFAKKNPYSANIVPIAFRCPGHWSLPLQKILILPTSSSSRSVALVIGHCLCKKKSLFCQHRTHRVPLPWSLVIVFAKNPCPTSFDLATPHLIFSVSLAYLSYNDAFLMFYIIFTRPIGALFLRRRRSEWRARGEALRGRSWRNKD